MSKLLIKILNFASLTISATLFIYYLKLYADTKLNTNLFLSILFTLIMLYTAHSLFKDKSTPFILVSLFIKAIPIIALTLMNIIIFRDHITVFKIIGIVLIIVGIITIDL